MFNFKKNGSVMKVFEKIQDLQQYLKVFVDQGFTIGYVPTMGALHQGHLSLIERSKNETKITVCSIFVNPTQFDDPKDLVLYPRTLVEDRAMLERAGCDVLFVPSVVEMYPEKSLNPDAKVPLQAELSKVELGILGSTLEAAHRKGHFQGVMQVVLRLFEIVAPKKAYFGQKDFQQLSIIKKMAADLNLGIEIVACPILRESDGLAMSSRNRRLSESDRLTALALSQVLFEAKKKAGTLGPVELKLWAENELKEKNGIVLEYFEIVNPLTMATVTEFGGAEGALACVAARIGKVRLIDNIFLS